MSGIITSNGRILTLGNAIIYGDPAECECCDDPLVCPDENPSSIVESGVVVGLRSHTVDAELSSWTTAETTCELLSATTTGGPGNVHRVRLSLGLPDAAGNPNIYINFVSDGATLSPGSLVLDDAAYQDPYSDTWTLGDRITVRTVRREFTGTTATEFTVSFLKNGTEMTSFDFTDPDIGAIVGCGIDASAIAQRVTGLNPVADVTIDFETRIY